ncbi:MAG: right-handed parallel beta-helix repeat-containing protein [Alphaproteobacteria bacterium]|nr:MAG: right-handed parallel beta-helix repeat-containing protein [Alphaproteobacteria bacterium]
MRQTIALLFLFAASASAAQAGAAPFTIRESGAGYMTLQDAVSAIGGGQGTIVIAPGRYRQCAVQEAGRVTYAAAQPGTAILDGVACQGKAALVLDGASATVEGLIFQNIRVEDGNGAGIRLQKGDLTVRESMFRNSESGILSHDDSGATIRIDRSTFSGLGRCDRGLDCAHSIYIGDYGNLIVERSRFERGMGGHYVKTRAARIEVTDSSFDDTAGHATNYMIDLSNGATGTIARNIFVQGKDKENYSAFIMVAAEGARHSSRGLAISGNDASIAPGIDRSTAFVAEMEAADVNIGPNRLGPRIQKFQQR